jgi:ribonuclease P protein component
MRYPQRNARKEASNARAPTPRFKLTMRRRARSNTALFRTGRDGDQADLPTFKDAARAASRLSGAQPHAWRTQGVAQPARERPAASRAVAAAAKRFGLDATRRLRQKAEFEHLLRQGARRSLGGYTFYLALREAGSARLGMLVTRKHAARAVERNRIKRCIREAFRLEREAMGALDLLVRPPYGIKPSAQMISRLRELFGSLKP